MTVPEVKGDRVEAVLLKKWESLTSRFHELTDQLMDPSVISQPNLLHKLSKERIDLEPAAKLFEQYDDYVKQLQETRQILADPSAGSELHKLAAEEERDLERRQAEVEERVREFLIPKDPRDEKSLVLEIRAGTGGDEAGLFAGELFRLYGKYA
jgi:peptide chain release factor 1